MSIRRMLFTWALRTEVSTPVSKTGKVGSRPATPAIYGRNVITVNEGGGNVMTGKGLTEKQKRFVDFYIETGNATEAAKKAGYKATNAGPIGRENLRKLTVKSAIDERLKEIKSSRVANAKEVMQFLTSAMRGETEEEIVVVEGLGDGMSEARIMEKHISAHDRLDAAKALLKRYQDVDSEEAVLRRDKLRAEVEALKTGGTEDTEITFKFERKQDDGS